MAAIAQSHMDKVLLIGVTGGTGGNVVKGFLEQGVTNMRAITRKTLSP
jgi:cell division GTPase FtsZ